MTVASPNWPGGRTGKFHTPVLISPATSQCLDIWILAGDPGRQGRRWQSDCLNEALRAHFRRVPSTRLDESIIFHRPAAPRM